MAAIGYGILAAVVSFCFLTVFMAIGLLAIDILILLSFLIGLATIFITWGKV